MSVKFIKSTYPVGFSDWLPEGICGLTEDTPVYNNSKLPICKGQNFNTSYGMVRVVRYIAWNHILVGFGDGTIVKVESSQLRKGQVRNPNQPIIFGVAYSGQGKYNSKDNKLAYQAWNGMLHRCYSDTRDLSYNDCEVAERWHNFQNFAFDYENMVGFGNPSWELDKDLLVKGNRIYSVDTCVLLPPCINGALAHSGRRRGEMPIGVRFDDRKTADPFLKYSAYCQVKNKQKRLGLFPSKKEAFKAYRSAKKKELKRMANLFKKDLDPRAYNALIHYKISYKD